MFGFNGSKSLHVCSFVRVCVCVCVAAETGPPGIYKWIQTTLLFMYCHTERQEMISAALRCEIFGATRQVKGQAHCCAVQM